MEFVPKFIERVQEKYNIDSEKLNSLWNGISSEKLQSSYRLYWKQQYETLKKMDHTLNLREAMKKISASWRTLSSDEKEHVYQKYISNIAVKYLPSELTEDDAHDYFESKNVDYLRKMVSSFYDGDENIQDWDKEKCIAFLVELNET